MPTEKKTVGIWTVRMLTKLNNRVKKQSLKSNGGRMAPKASKVELKVDQNHPNRANRAATATKMEAKVRQWSL